MDADSYVTDAEYRKFVLDRFDVALSDSPDSSSAPSAGATLQSNRDFFTVNPVTGEVVNAGEETVQRGFTAPSTITTGASTGDSGVVIGNSGIYSAELQLRADVTRASEGKLTAVLQREGSEGDRERMVEAEINLDEITSLQPYTINLELRENTLASGDHIFYKIEYESTAQSAFLQFNIASGRLSLTQYVYGRGTGVAEVTDSVESQESDLRRATDYLDNLYIYTGTPASMEQALAFPRTGMTVIPARVKKAQMYLANELRTGELDVSGGSINKAITTDSTSFSLPGGLSRSTAKVNTQTDSHLPNNPTVLANRHPLVEQLMRPWIMEPEASDGAIVSKMELA